MAVAFLALALVGGCNSAPGTAQTPAPTTPDTTATATPTPTPSTPDPTALASEAALAAYRGFRQAQVTAERTADASYQELERYAGDKALADERVNLVHMANSGVVMTGEPTFNPEVTNVALGASPTVTITDCIDTTGWAPIYEATGESAAAPGQPTRVLATALARPYGDGWLITEVTTDRSRPC